jgi:hypothetical protein
MNIGTAISISVFKPLIYLQFRWFGVHDLEICPPWPKTHGASQVGFWALLMRKNVRLNWKTPTTSWLCSSKLRGQYKTSGMNTTQGLLVSGSNSVLLASCRPRIDRANSMTAICIPRQIPRNGILFSRAYLAARIFPSTPLSPNPPGTRTPSAPCRHRLVRRLRKKVSRTLRAYMFLVLKMKISFKRLTISNTNL